MSLKKDVKAAMCEMYANGATIRTIASAFCVSYNTVHGMIRRDYKGILRAKTPVHIILKSKV